jgi:hypothetical protein
VVRAAAGRRLRVEGPAADWVRAATAGSEVLDESGRVLRRASGAHLPFGRGRADGSAPPRAELADLGRGGDPSLRVVADAIAALEATMSALAEREAALADSMAQADRPGRRSGRAPRSARTPSGSPAT